MGEKKNNFTLSLYINDALVPLKPFLQRFVSQIVLSLVRNLKDIPKPEKVELKLEELKS